MLTLPPSVKVFLADGTYVPEDPPGVPILGVSGEDVRDFVEWRNARAQLLRERWRWSVPTFFRWERAARGADGRLFPWGNRFDGSLCVSAPSHLVIRVVRPGSEPRDESPFGVLDITGSRQEWVAEGFLKGGLWGRHPHRSYRARRSATASGRGT